MNNSKFIKEIYALKDTQEDLRFDSIYIFAQNMTVNFKTFSGRAMTKKEIDNYVEFMYNRLIVENEIETEWNQTS